MDSQNIKNLIINIVNDKYLKKISYYINISKWK